MCLFLNVYIKMHVYAEMYTKQIYRCIQPSLIFDLRGLSLRTPVKISEAAGTGEIDLTAYGLYIYEYYVFTVGILYVFINIHVYVYV
jgi:hypothetical protein